MITIVDYDAGNLTSVKRALDFLGINSEITSDPAKVKNAERIIFPGVGHAASANKFLNEKGLSDALKEAFLKGTPILGICLGTQIILSHSEEGDTECLGLLKGNCPRFDLKDKHLKIPHMGWNKINILQSHPVLSGTQSDDEFYFVHSYYPRPNDNSQVIADCEYEIRFPAVIGEKNLIATQFHVEKSGPAGLRLLTNFSKWNGSRC